MNLRGCYYGNTNEKDHKYVRDIINKHRNEKLWSIELYFSTKREKGKRKKTKDLFYCGYKNSYPEELSYLNGLFTFDEAFKLFKEFDLEEYKELIRLNYDMISYMKPYNHEWSGDHLLLVRRHK